MSPFRGCCLRPGALRFSPGGLCRSYHRASSVPPRPRAAGTRRILPCPRRLSGCTGKRYEGVQGPGSSRSPVALDGRRRIDPAQPRDRRFVARAPYSYGGRPARCEGEEYVSNTALGAWFEAVVVEALRPHRLSCWTVGKKGDRGVDFRGNWMIKRKDCRTGAPAEEGEVDGVTGRFPVVGQCKYSEKYEVGPAVVREMVGNLAAEPVGTVGVVASSCGFTVGAIRECCSADYPMVLVNVSVVTSNHREESTPPACNAMFFNNAISRLIPGLSAVSAGKSMANGAPSKVMLLLDGQPLR